MTVASQVSGGQSIGRQQEDVWMVISPGNRRAFGQRMDDSRIGPAGPGVFGRPSPGHARLQDDADGLSCKSREVKLAFLPSTICPARARPKLCIKNNLAPRC